MHRRILPVLLTVLALVVAACGNGDQSPTVTGERPTTTEAAEPADGDADAAYEVWAVDQGTHTVYVLDPELEVLDTIELAGHGVETPHMIDFTSDGAYAFIAATRSGNVTVIRTEDREVVEVLPVGVMAHMAVVAPDDGTLLVADMAEHGVLVEYELDLEAETFTRARELVVAEDPLIAERADEFPGTSPVCHAFTDDGSVAYVTLGPSLDSGGLVVLDVESFELVAVFPPSEVAANCGTHLSADGQTMFVNGGSADTEGRWWAFDVETHEVVGEGSSQGNDAHGLALTPDGAELWMVNRATSNAVIVDPDELAVVEEIDFVGQSPDIIVIAPDGERAYVTLRGPEPQSGPHAIAGDTPGVAVLDVANRELLEVVQPDEGNPASDFHGIWIRPNGAA